MSASANRRRFLHVTAASTLGGWELLSRLPAVSAAEARVQSQHVRLEAGIEPLVQLLETTERGQVLEVVAEKIRRGTSYQEVLAALQLAGVRNVQPRPSVGFKFHAVLVVNSAHLASLASADEHRWLPIFWALDEFKDSQADDRREGDWTMGRVDESAVPRPNRATAAFVAAMDNWDVEAADAAAAGLARGVAKPRVFELFCQYAARDFRSIGHKAIFLANGWRTLETIGWQHAEPILRSLAYAMLMHTGEPNPAKSDLAADRPWRHNQTLVKQIGEGWKDGKTSDEVTLDLLKMFREANAAQASEQFVTLLNNGTSPQTLWDAMFLSAGELLARQPAIVPLHAMTTSNAVHYLYRTTRDPLLQQKLLLQNAAFLTLFRDAAQGRRQLADTRIDEFKVDTGEKGQPEELREQILADITHQPDQAAQGVMNYLNRGGDAQSLLDAARLQVFFKGTNSHDYKFSSAVLEDYFHLSPRWRDRYLAASVYKLRGTGGRDNPIVARTLAAFEK